MWGHLFNIWFSTSVSSSDLHFLFFNSSLCQQIFFKTVYLSLQILVLGLQLLQCVPRSLNSSQQVFFLTTHCFILEKDKWSLLGHKHTVNLPVFRLTFSINLEICAFFLSCIFLYTQLQLIWQETNKSYLNPFTTNFEKPHKKFKLKHFPRRYEFNLFYSIISHTELFYIVFYQYPDFQLFCSTHTVSTNLCSS